MYLHVLKDVKFLSKRKLTLFLSVQTCEGVIGYAVEACCCFRSNNTFNYFSSSLCWGWSTCGTKV